MNFGNNKYLVVVGVLILILNLSMFFFSGSKKINENIPSNDYEMSDEFLEKSSENLISDTTETIVPTSTPDPNNVYYLNILSAITPTPIVISTTTPTLKKTTPTPTLRPSATPTLKLTATPTPDYNMFEEMENIVIPPEFIFNGYGN